MTGVTEVISRSKRRLQDESDLDVFRALKRQKEMVAQDANQLARRLKDSNAIAKRLDNAIEEMTVGKSTEELLAFMKAPLVELMSEMTDDEDDGPAVA